MEFDGVIDEHSNFKELLLIDQDNIVFNLKNVTTLNSSGMKEWLNFLDQIPAEKKINYENCPPILIEQMNMVLGFIRNKAVVTSFYAPYSCEDCGLETKLQIKVGQVQNMKIPHMACPHCGKEKMGLDAEEDQYLSFLKQA